RTSGFTVLSLISRTYRVCPSKSADQLSITSLLYRYEAEPSVTQLNRAGFVRVEIATAQYQTPAVILLVRAVKQSHHSHELSISIHRHIERHAAFGHHQQFF